MGTDHSVHGHDLLCKQLIFGGDRAVCPHFFTLPYFRRTTLACRTGASRGHVFSGSRLAAVLIVHYVGPFVKAAEDHFGRLLELAASHRPNINAPQAR